MKTELFQKVYGNEIFVYKHSKNKLNKMKVSAFITSGILEKYVLGMVSEEEVIEVLDMASQHIEIKEEIAAIRKTVKGYILTHQIAVPGNIRAKVLADTSPQQKKTNKKAISKTNTNSIGRAAKSEPGNWVKTFLVLGLVILGILCTTACYFAYEYMQQLESTKGKMVVTSQEVAEFKKKLASEQEYSKGLLAQLAFYRDRNNRIALLKGNRRALGANATIYWNAASKSAFIDVESLPVIVEDKSLVLWAVANGRSNKIGVLVNNPPGERSSLTYVENPKSFYVTEESNAEVTRSNRSRILMTGDF